MMNQQQSNARIVGEPVAAHPGEKTTNASSGARAGIRPYMSEGW
jgi:hypothetical protein